MATTRYARVAGHRPGAAQGRLRPERYVGSFEPTPQLRLLQPALRALSEVADAAPRRTETQAALQYVLAKGCVPLPSVTFAETALEVAGAIEWELGLDELHALHQQALALHVRRPDVPWLRGL